MPHNTILNRIRAEYLEVPGLRLTVEQARRLCGVQGALCQCALDTLVDTEFLRVKSDGAYARSADSSRGRREGREIPNVYLSNAELKALQDVFEAAKRVDWAAYDRAKARIQHAARSRLHPAKANLRTDKRPAQAS